MKHVKLFEGFKDEMTQYGMDMKKVKSEQKDLKQLDKHLKNIDDAFNWWLEFKSKYDNNVDIVWNGPVGLIMNDLNRLMRGLNKDQIAKVYQRYKDGQKI